MPTLNNFFAGEILSKIACINEEIVESVTPSAPYALNMSEIKEELASGGNTVARTYAFIVLSFLKTLLTLVIVISYVCLIKEQARAK